jgi:hypothetical protein
MTMSVLWMSRLAAIGAPMKFDLVSGVLFVLGGLLWAVVARQFVPFTRIGVAIVAMPALVLTAVGVIRLGLYLIDKLQKQR